MAEILPEVETFARIKVIGVGGGGMNAVERMIKAKVQGIEFVAVNTDAQALHYANAQRKVHIGKETTRGLGAGADPEQGRKAAEESEAEIYEMLKGSDMVFITLGEGGGTGTGAAPLIAAAAKETGALVVGICTKPFTFEGERRRKSAEVGIQELKSNVDTLITIPNDRLLQMIDRKTSLLDAFSVVDDVLMQGVQGISDLITVHGLINLDFADIKAVMSDAGSALMGIGRASGDNRAIEAARQAIDSPLLETSVDGARGVLFNITGGRNMSMHEIDEAAKTITAAVDSNANIIFGAVLDESLDDDIKITVVATGFDQSKQEHKPVLHGGSQTPAPVREAAPEPVATTSFDRSTFASSYEPEPVLPPARKPFIDERPRYAPEPEPAAELFNEEPKHEVHEAKSRMHVTSIEPDPDEDLLSRPKEEPTHEALDMDGAEDDLDIPAFIRRKVE